jgi:glycosyltransferase involved in cell wall biosynthesis
MNIAIDARSLESGKTGVGRYLAGLLRCWKNSKKHQFILYFKDKIPDDNLLKSDNFELKLLKNPFGFSSNFFFQHFLLPYYLKKDKINFFFSPFYLKPFYCQVKSSIVLHDISYETRPEWFDFKSQFILRALSKFSAKTSDIIFTVSDFSKSEIIKFYKINPDKITVTHLAPDDGFTKIDNAEKIKNLKEKYNLKNKFILSIGSIFSRRHMLEIIGAFEKIADKYNDYQFLIIGRNHTHPFVDINNKIKTVNKNLDRNAIVHLNFVSEEELLIFYNLCESSIYLSDYEGFGLPVIEAQFFGKPVITSYNSSLIEVGRDSVEFVKNNTADEIYNSLNKIISDEDYKNRLVELGGENIKRFSWEKCANKTLEKILDIKY